MADESLSHMERRTLEAFDRLDPEDRERMVMIIAAMRAGIEIDHADLIGKSPEELRQFADQLWQKIAAKGGAH